MDISVISGLMAETGECFTLHEGAMQDKSSTIIKLRIVKQAGFHNGEIKVIPFLLRESSQFNYVENLIIFRQLNRWKVKFSPFCIVDYQGLRSKGQKE